MKQNEFKKHLTVLAIGAALCGPGSSANASVIGLDLEGDYVQVPSDNWTLGYEFSLASTAQVDGLGFWDMGNGFNETTVGLWKADGSLLGMVNSASSTVSSFATGSVGTWNFMDFSMTLGAGNYVVASWGRGMEYAYQFPRGTITTNILSFVHSRELFGGSFQYPVNAYCTTCEGLFGGNVRFAEGVSVVPEPGTVSLMALTVFGLASARRKRNK